MAELQTVAAVLDLLKATIEAGKFFRKVARADRIAVDIAERIERLSDILEGVYSALKFRRANDVATSGDDAIVAIRVNQTVRSCSQTLLELKEKLGGFATQQGTFLDRWKVAFRQPSIDRVGNELEARIQILATDLAVLQVFDNTKTSADAAINYHELSKALAAVLNRVEEGHAVLNTLRREQQELAARIGRRPSSSASLVDELSVFKESDAIEVLNQCLQSAESVHDRYTSEYLPDDRSQRYRRGISTTSTLSIRTPSRMTISSPSVISDRTSAPSAISAPSEMADSDDDEVDAPPLEILDRFIAGYLDRVTREMDKGGFNQAEVNLHHAIRYSKMREEKYGVPFDRRAELEEELAFLLQKQKKWADAVTKVSGLLRERAGGDQGPEATLVQARQHALVASIYFERHTSNAGAALSHSTEDIEQAEIHANRAARKRWRVYGTGPPPAEEAERDFECIQLLIRILEYLGKTVEANELIKMLAERDMPGGSNAERKDSVGDPTLSRNRSLNIGPRGTSDDLTSPTGSGTKPTEPAESPHEALVNAIKIGDTDQIQAILMSKDVKVEHVNRENKTLLMYAVEKKDEPTVHKLLDPENGAEVNTANRRGLTSLHLAAAQGLHDMMRCLLNHDADVDVRDRKGETPMIKAVKAGDTTSVQILYEKDENTLAVKGFDEWNLLHYAVRGKSTEMTAYLLDSMPGLKDAADLAGKIALHHCAEDERLEQCVQLLQHRHKSDVNASDSVGRTPLYLAASKPHTAHREEMVRLLVLHGALIDERRPPLRVRDYPVIKRVSRRDSAISRTTTVSTTGTMGTTSTQTSRLSRFASRFSSV